MDSSTHQHFADCVKGLPCEPPAPDTRLPKRMPPVAANCHCEVHTYSPRVEQYKNLLEKEQKLCQDYELLMKQMVDVTNDILDHPCDNSHVKMSVMYDATLKKRPKGLPPYKKLAPDSDSPAPIPMEKHLLGILTGFKEPNVFPEKPPTVRPTIHPPGVIHTGLAPHSVVQWFKDYPGRTEYMDAYSASAKATLRSMKRYLEPLPSTRRRADDRVV